MNEPDRVRLGPGARRGLLALVLLVFAGLVRGVVSLPPGGSGLIEPVEAHLAATGVENPVTATLLNFRGYDTLLEITVLLVAVIATWAIRRGAPPTQYPPGEVLAALARVQVPLMILVAGYLLWSGAHAPGGAFQAGAVLAAAGVLFVLAGDEPIRSRDELVLRIGLGVGLALFVAFGITGPLRGVAFLGYPREGAGGVTLALEVGATLSVAVALFEMFRGVLRGRSVRAATIGSGGELQ